jgi:predicted metal-dependent hydrolase
MSTNHFLMIVGNLEALVVHKPVKHLHLSILPPNGKVRVTAPLDTKDDQVRVFITTKIAWIRKQQTKFLNQRRQTQRKYVSGETYYYLGRSYRLRVESVVGKAEVLLKGNDSMILRVEAKASVRRKEQMVTEWYRQQLKELLNDLIPKWHKKLKVQPKHWRIQRMKTRWGTCNQNTGRILLNLELIKKPVECIEYVLVHEWLHLLEPKQNDNFLTLLTKHFPKWKHAKDELSRFIASHEKWENNPV